MLILKWLLISVLLLVLATVAAGQAGLLRGKMPADLGVHEGRLKGLSATPNSVSSQAGLYPDHAQRSYALIAPLALRGDGPATLARLKAVLQGIDGCRLITEQPDYLYAQCSTRWLKFTDDVEFWFDPAAQVVQVRSASRLGRKDMGVNRARVESVRAALGRQA
jgi:uncharacterized protein (DUF1499 family)